VSLAPQALLRILQQLVASPAPTAPEVCLCMRLALKAFWSATYMGIPDPLAQPATMNEWMGTLLVALAQTAPEVRVCEGAWYASMCACVLRVQAGSGRPHS